MNANNEKKMEKINKVIIKKETISFKNDLNFVVDISRGP